MDPLIKSQLLYQLSYAPPVPTSTGARPIPRPAAPANPPTNRLTLRRFRRHLPPMPRFVTATPEGDTRTRQVCADCGHIAYENPKIVAGALILSGDRVLLCRRAIEPRLGFWTLPAGYMELGETVEEAARREAAEEAEADIVLEGMLALFSIARIGQVHILYRARFADPAAPHFAAGHETLEAALFSYDRIPWSDLAFPTITWALRAWHAAGPGPLGPPATNPPKDPRGVHRAGRP